MDRSIPLSDRISFMIVSLSIGIVGAGFLILGVSLLPGIGLLVGFASFMLIYSLWHTKPYGSTIEVAIKILTEQMQYTNALTAPTIPIAILSTSTEKDGTFDFDPRVIDATTLRLEPTGTKPVKETQQYDIDGDGDVDLVIHFPAPELGHMSGKQEICITGTTTKGEFFRGCTDLDS